MVWKKENGCTKAELGCSSPVEKRILVARDNFAHQHDWNDFTGLCEDLGGEWNEFEGFVLEPGGKNVRQRAERVFVEGASKYVSLEKAI